MLRDEVEKLPWMEVPGSSNVARVAYVMTGEDYEVGRLFVEFNSTGERVYAYEKVPLVLWLALGAVTEDPDGSVGRFVGQRVRGEFECEKIEVEGS